MAIALGITGVTAYLVSTSPSMLSLLYQTPLQWVVMFAPIVFVFIFSAKVSSMTSDSAKLLFWGFSVLMGLSLSWIFVAYTGTSVSRVFFISASMFGAMALFGNNTKADLTAMGSFLIMGVVGILIASIVNIFLQSAAVYFAVSFLGVIIFTGLTAYDVQRIKDSYYLASNAGESALSKVAILGALTLYFDFINIFISLLNLMGERK
ncbi:inhibitor of apoptosis-promoting Bax1 family protein [Neorickettsia helminthoeca str. Oregon]|uniref:Inhibitor of apoptosis-promoting Bax1 family protein n=2 Tax=Neorickettsia helminthoeca TaxID=33994 RepID=X5H3B4_9RICK|nr:inhibitor of apoptosis-promoting Bax1 family protein [Neorickettsia helminthoeca str. Oregon]